MAARAPPGLVMVNAEPALLGPTASPAPHETTGASTIHSALDRLCKARPWGRSASAGPRTAGRVHLLREPRRLDAAMTLRRGRGRRLLQSGRPRTVVAGRLGVGPGRGGAARHEEDERRGGQQTPHSLDDHAPRVVADPETGRGVPPPGRHRPVTPCPPGPAPGAPGGGLTTGPGGRPIGRPKLPAPSCVAAEANDAWLEASATSAPPPSATTAAARPTARVRGRAFIAIPLRRHAVELPAGVAGDRHGLAMGLNPLLDGRLGTAAAVEAAAGQQDVLERAAANHRRELRHGGRRVAAVEAAHRHDRLAGRDDDRRGAARAGYRDEVLRRALVGEQIPDERGRGGALVVAHAATGAAEGGRGCRTGEGVVAAQRATGGGDGG